MSRLTASIASLAVVALLAPAVAEGAKLPVTPENPYYDLVAAEQRAPVGLGERIRG